MSERHESEMLVTDLAREARGNPYSMGTVALADVGEEVAEALDAVAKRADEGHEVGDELRAMADRFRFYRESRADRRESSDG
jgi:hypothetical protein